MRRLASGRARRRYAAWRRFQARLDRLVDHQSLTSRVQHPMRTCPGFFRAEGWPTDRGELRHGC